jgi:hypothetical protein
VLRLRLALEGHIPAVSNDLYNPADGP